MSAQSLPQVGSASDLTFLHGSTVSDRPRELLWAGASPAFSGRPSKPLCHPNLRAKSVIPRLLLSPLTAGLVLLCSALSLCAQTTFTESVFSDAPGNPQSDLIQASDGNFYGTTLTGGANNMGSVFQLTPAGVLTTLHSFSGTDGSYPYSGVVEGRDGLLYGTTFGTQKSTDPAGFGTIYDLTTKGSFETLYTFTGGSDGGDPEGALVQGNDGNFYGTTKRGGDLSILNPSGVFFRITPVGAYTVMTTFTGPQYGTIADQAGTMIQGADGNFYGTSQLGGAYTDDGTVFSESAAGAPTLLWSFTGNADGFNPTYPPLVQVADGSFYGANVESYQGTGGGIIFQYTPGNIAQAHGFTSGAGGRWPYSGLTLASDGNLYGTTLVGGLASCQNVNSGGVGCGIFYQINPKSYAFASLYSFGPSPDASEPNRGTPIQASDGNFYGVTYLGGSDNTGAVYKIVPSPSLPPPIQMSFSGTSPALPNVPVTLSWKVLNAFSTTAQQCVAYIQGTPNGAGSWRGIQSGTLNQGVYGGSAVITPTIGGTYTYALTCGGRQSGFATLVVKSGYEITTTSLPDATVLKPYKVQLATTGGNDPDTWSIGGSAPNLPDGLTLDSGTGIISGTPVQFGAAQNITLIATDSSTPPLKATVTLPLTVLSGLKITTTSLVKGTVKANYKQLLTATGGLPGLSSTGADYYNWSIITGKLPPGLTLGPTTGMITGKPTSAGTTSLTIQVADIETPAATATVTLNLVIAPTAQIAAVEFTQVIQEYQTLSDLQASLAANNAPPVPMVTGKPAVMRVYFTSLNDATSVTLTASGAVAGTQILSLMPNCQPTDARAHNSGCPSMDFYFTPPTGTWTTTLTLMDDFGNQLEQETFSITSKDTYAINLKGVSACSVVSSPASCQDPSVLLGLTALVSKLMPTNTVNPSITSSKVSLNVAAYSDHEAWVDAMVSLINPLYLPADAAADVSGQTRTDYSGVYDPSISSTGISGYGGHNLLVPARAPRLGRDATLAVVAHETGHTLSLTHTELDNPASTNGLAPGCYGPGAPIRGAPTNWIYATDNVQSSAGPEYGFDVASQAVIDPTNTYDIMSYCVPRWISPINYNRAFAALNGGTVTTASLGKVPANPLTRPAAQPTATPPLVQGSYWGVSGSIQSAGVTLNPIFTETMSAFTDPGTGTYSIQALSATNQPLYTRYFTPAIDTTDTTGTDIMSDPLFSEWIPVTSGAASIAVFDSNGILLTNLPLTGAPPTVTITSPLAGFVGSGEQMVSWTIQSATATNFTSKISYSIDSGTTWNQIDQLASTSDIIDFSTLPGTAAALIRIDVSDGVNTGSATSVPFNVPKKLPSAIVINNPVSGAIYPAKNPVYLSGAAYDADDGVLTGTALKWTDSAQGALGSGSPLTVNMSPGNHTITLTGTDSDRNAITATTQITLAGDAPALSLTTSQVGATCINATISANPGAQGADLTQVNYSLDGGATYTAILLNSLPFSFSVPGSGAVNLVAVAIDASGQSSAQSTELNLGAGCAVTPPLTITPTVTVTPSPTSITTAQALTVTIGVSGGSGNPTPSGSVTLSSGSYTSAATTLVSGSAMITVPAGSLATSTDTLTATYTPDSASSSTYNGATGSNTVTVTSPAKTTPTVTVSPSSSSITTAQSLTVTIGVSGGSGNPTPTGSVTLTSGSYTSAATTLVSGSAMITVPAGSLATSTDTLTATYTPDSNSSSTYNNATGTNTVTVTAATVQVTVGTNPAGLSFSVDGTSYTSTQTLSWTVGSSHSIATTSPQTSAGMQNTFTSWSDEGAISHSVTAPSSATSYTATFATSYQLTTAASPTAGGSVAPTSGTYYASGSVVNLTATPSSGYSFTNWTGSVASTSSASTTVTMSAPETVTANFSAVTPPSFTMSSSTMAQTIQPGGSAHYTITVTPQNGTFSSAVTLSASGLPVGATAMFSPPSLTPGSSPATSTLTIQTASTAAAATPKSSPWQLAVPALAVIGIFFLPGKKRRRWITLAALAIASLGAFSALTACGGGFGMGASATSYTITVTGTGGSVQQSTTVQLTVE